MKPSIPPLTELYGSGTNGNFMLGEYTSRTDIHEAIQNRHRRGMSRIDAAGNWVEGDHVWKVPYGVRIAFTERLLFTQVANKFPFYVQWQHPDGKGGKKPLRRSCMSLGSACSFIATKAQYVDPDAFVVNKLGFYIPRKLMGKFPRRMGDPERLHYWCPRCMQPRRFKRSGDRTFYAQKKFWNQEKDIYEWKNVKLALIECTSCGITNRDNKFRASNQPLEVKAIKQGRTRTRRRR